MTELGNTEKQQVGRWANNRVENSHLSFRRRERAMLRFRRMACLQKFASVHANVHSRVDMLDIFALSGLEWVYDRVEDRFGRVAAWFVTMTLALAVLGIAAAVLIAVL